MVEKWNQFCLKQFVYLPELLAFSKRKTPFLAFFSPVQYLVACPLCWVAWLSPWIRESPTAPATQPQEKRHRRTGWDPQQPGLTWGGGVGTLVCKATLRCHLPVGWIYLWGIQNRCCNLCTIWLRLNYSLGCRRRTRPPSRWNGKSEVSAW